MSRSDYQKANDMLSQLRSIDTTLEYYERVERSPTRKHIIGLTRKSLQILEEDIYENDLHGVGRLL